MIPGCKNVRYVFPKLHLRQAGRRVVHPKDLRPPYCVALYIITQVFVSFLWRGSQKRVQPCSSLALVNLERMDPVCRCVLCGPVTHSLSLSLSRSLSLSLLRAPRADWRQFVQPTVRQVPSARSRSKQTHHFCTMAISKANPSSRQTALRFKFNRQFLQVNYD